MSKPVVLDTSAVLAMLNEEPGAERVQAALTQAVIGTVNLAEVVTKLRGDGLSEAEVEEVVGLFNFDIRPLTAAQAVAVGHLRPATRAFGLSLGARACLVLAAELGATALAADRDWAKLDADVLGTATVELIR